MDNIWGSLILLVVLIFLNAIFASAEIAVISVNENKLKRMAEEGNKKAKKLLKLTADTAKFLATIQVAITFAGFLQSASAAQTFAEPLAALFLKIEALQPFAGVVEGVSLVLITLVLAYFNLVFGELVPKRIAMKKAEKMALGMAGMLYAFSKIAAPLVWLLSASTNGVLRLFRINPAEEAEPVTEEEIRFLLSEGEEQGNIHTEETELIENIFEFNDIQIEEICTHRMDMVTLDIEDDVTEWYRVIAENRHTYYPICNGDADEIVAVLNAKDYFRLEDKSKENLMAKATEPPLFVPTTMKANVLFRKMREERRYFTVLLDEYGGVAGIATLHDLVETLVGDLEEGETQSAEADFVKNEEGSYTVLGTATLRDLTDEFGIDVTHEDYDTFSGYIVGIIGRVPTDGETFDCEDSVMQIKVTEVKNHVIVRATVTLKPREDAELHEYGEAE